MPAPNPPVDGPAVPAEGTGSVARFTSWLNPSVAAAIGFAVLLLFAYAIIKTLLELGTAPVAANATVGTEGYSSFDRAVQVVGLVSPVLTIVLGFYFGARAGTAEADAAKTSAQQQIQQTHAVIQETAKDPSATAADALDAVRKALPRAFIQG